MPTRQTSELVAQPVNGGRYLTRREAAQYLRISLMSLHSLMVKKRIPVIRPTPKRVLLDRGDLDRYLESTKEPAAT